MPLHSLQRLSATAVLGLWHRTEPVAALWPLLPPGLVPAYRALAEFVASVMDSDGPQP